MVFKKKGDNIKKGKMSAIPQGAFATIKIKQNLMKSTGIEFKEETNEVKFFGHFLSNDANFEHPLLKYNSKLMNSIWGLYNRYSVHNFKKNAASGNFAVYSNQRL